MNVIALATGDISLVNKDRRLSLAVAKEGKKKKKRGKTKKGFSAGALRDQLLSVGAESSRRNSANWSVGQGEEDAQRQAGRQGDGNASSRSTSKGEC